MPSWAKQPGSVEVLRLIAKGRGNKVIAADRAHAVTLAIEQGF